MNTQEAAQDANAEIRRLKQALAMANTGGLKLIYDVRAALGWNGMTDLSLLPGGVKDLRKALTQIRAYHADRLSELDDMKARGDLTKDWGEAGHTSALLSLNEVDRILQINRIDGIKP